LRLWEINGRSKETVRSGRGDNTEVSSIIEGVNGRTRQVRESIQEAADKILGRSVDGAIDRLNSASEHFELKFILWIRILIVGAVSGGMAFI